MDPDVELNLTQVKNKFRRGSSLFCLNNGVDNMKFIFLLC